MSFIKIWVHIVWATYNRNPYLNDKIRNKIFYHIKEYASQKKIHLDHINGYYDHVHSLVSLKADQNIATIANLLKGESSHWINKNRLVIPKFAWQDEYYAASVSESQIEKVRKYIRNQEKHHKTISSQEEHKEFVKEFGFDENNHDA